MQTEWLCRNASAVQLLLYIFIHSHTHMYSFDGCLVPWMCKIDILFMLLERLVNKSSSLITTAVALVLY